MDKKGISGAMMKGRPSTDRRSGEDGYGSKETYEQKAFVPTDQGSQQIGSGRGSADLVRHKFMGPAAREDQMSSGSLSPPPIDGRNGRERDVPQNLPSRERSRANGSADGRNSTSTARICTKCHEPLQGKYLRALGGTYHLGCFKCMVSCREFIIAGRWMIG